MMGCACGVLMLRPTGSMLSSALRLTMPTVAQSHRRSSWRRLPMSKWESLLRRSIKHLNP